MTSTEPPVLDDELEAPSTRQTNRRWWLVGVLGCAAMLAVITWFAISATSGRLAWQTHSYDVRERTAVQVTFDLHRPAGLAVTCRLTALDERFGTVGSLDVAIPAGPARSVRSTATIRATAPTVTGIVSRCTPSATAP